MSDGRRQAIADAPTGCALFDLLPDVADLRPAGCP
jgi:hypothetical protein